MLAAEARRSIVRYPRLWIILTPVFVLGASASASAADNIDVCIGNAARILQFAPQIGTLRAQAEAEVSASQSANPNLDDTQAEEMVGRAYAPMMRLCEQLRVRETNDLCSSILNDGSAGDRADDVTRASQSLQNDPITTCYAQ
jgi:hypothetical protein